MFADSQTIAATDPDLWGAVQSELRRQEEGIELIASENYASPAVLAAQGTVLTNKYAEGYPGQALLRRLRIRRRGRNARHRAREAALRRRVRERAAALGLAGEPGGVHGDAEAGRHDPRHVARARRPPHARRFASTSRASSITPWATAWTRRRRSTTTRCARSREEHKPSMIVAGASAYALRIDWQRFRAIADEVGAYAHGRHGALRGPGRRGRSIPRPVRHRRFRDQHHAQDAARPARRA